MCFKNLDRVGEGCKILLLNDDLSQLLIIQLDFFTTVHWKLFFELGNGVHDGSACSLVKSDRQKPQSTNFMLVKVRHQWSSCA